MAINSHKSLIGFQERFKEIQGIEDDNIKSIRLAALMTDMESAYEFPMVGPLRIAAFKQSFPGVMKLYKEVSQARCFG
ncbi:hypothetical protein [Gracilibacillus salinarum]|uniref:Uncharacterized protein n=1 Tax=Gracilibacillus salinarum TaxID=2932255 RepID=A0ABY4GMR2_9BACI|nr:hypothetical protein [Gracilibacillus salinarum]UOQ85663.1 hypothetical protein MUN87_01790 [Gracilibacillus salinarum]